MNKIIRESIFAGITELVLIGIVLIVCSAVAVGQDTKPTADKGSMVYNGVPITQDAKTSPVLNRIISIHAKAVPLLEVMKDIAAKSNLEIVYNSRLLDKKNRPININLDQVTVEEALWSALEGTGLRFAISADKQLVLLERKEAKDPPQRWLAIAQETITGSVTDAQSGVTLPGVNILVKGTSTGTSTDSEGSFELTVESLQDTLVVSYIGYQTKKVPIQGRTTLKVVLQPQAISGEEVVVIGYGSQKRQDLTGSISSVDVEALNRQSEPQVAQKLQGQISGVNVVTSGEPGAEPMINIRGFNTFGDNSPLYVVDGIPTKDISSLNSNNIASMQVMKDAAAASIYGSRAANGVIIITTKQGKGEISVTYSSYFGWQVPKCGNVWDLLSPQEMAELKWMTVRNSGGDPTPDPQYGNGSSPVLPDYIVPAGASEGDPSVDPNLYNLDPNYTDASKLSDFYQIIRANKSGTNWYQEIFSPAPMTNNNISVSGGGDQGNFFLSLNYLNQQGTLMETYLKRYTIRANTQFNVNENIRIGENLAYSISQNPQMSNTLNSVSAIGMSHRMQPIVPVYDIMGNFAGSNGPAPGAAKNPVGMLYRTRNDETQGNRLFGNVFAEIDFLNNLTFRSNFGGTINAADVKAITYPEYENTLNTTINQVSQSSTYRHDWTWSNTLTFETVLNEIHAFEGMIGTEIHEFKGEGVGGTTQDYYSFDPSYMNLSTGSGTKTNSAYTNTNGLFSIFGRVEYSYDNKYLLSGTLRRDGSSKFTNNRYGWFPSVSAGWRITEEPFMEGIEWLTDVKIRGAYGIMGNQLNVAAGNSYTLFSGSEIASYYDIKGTSSELVQGFMKQRIGNPNAEWEKNINANIGIDATLFDGRLKATADYYRKDIQDLLYNPELIGAAGNAAAPFVNVGNIKNEGLDASIQAMGTINDNLSYSTKFTLTTYYNEIVKIAEGEEYFDLDTRRFGTTIIRNAVGHEMSSYYGYKIIGFWDSNKEIQEANEKAPSGTYQEGIGVGRFRYRDSNGDGEITAEDREFLGSPHPNFSYGFNLALKYKSFDFSLFLYGVQGTEIWNNVKWFTDFSTSFQGARSKTALYDSWTEDNKNATAPIQENEGSFSTNGVPNSYYVEDGSYLRAKNLTLGYTLPTTLTEKLNIQRLRIYVQTDDLFTITGYSGIDPEIGGSNSTNFGIDEGAYATPRQYLVGINLAF